MADSNTANYNFIKPEVGGSDDTWGEKLNDNMDLIDSNLKTIDGRTAVSKVNLADLDWLGVYDSEVDPVIVKKFTWAQLKTALMAGLDPWAFFPLGFPFPLMTHIPGISPPPTDNPLYRYVLLTAGQSGIGGYNNGVLTSESVSGSAPLVNATAVISLPGSPIDGESIRLVNTERRFIRPGDTAGSVQDDAYQEHSHGAIAHNVRTWQPVAGAGIVPVVQVDGTNTDPNLRGTTGSQAYNNGAPRVSTETRPRNIWLTHYMRVL